MVDVGDFIPVDSYPGDAAGGACFLTLADIGEIFYTDPDTNEVRVRRERALVTPIEVPFEGQVCISERAVRYMGTFFGLYDGHLVDKLKADHAQLEEHLGTVSRQAAELAEQVRFWQEMAESEQVKVYVALDGTEHLDRRAAADASARALEAAPLATALRPLSVEDAPRPEGKVPA